jgi:hypothetical protein
LEDGAGVRCPQCQEHFTWSEDEERSPSKTRKQRNKGGRFPVIPVAIGIGAVAIGIVVLIVVLRASSKKADPAPVPTVEAPTPRPKSPDEKGPKGNPFGQLPAPPPPKGKTPDALADPPPDKWEKDPLVSLNRNPDKFVGQMLVLEARMTLSVRGTKENPKYEIIHIGTGRFTDRLYFTASPATHAKLVKSNLNLSQIDRVRLTTRVEDRKLEGLRVVNILKFEFLTARGDVVMSVE